MRKRVIAFLLAFCMAAGFLPVPARAASDEWVTVIFDAGDGQWPDGTCERDAEVLLGQTCDDIPADPERAGFTFTGWLTEDGEAFTGDTEVSDDTVVLAQWEENPMTTVTFDACGGWWVVETVTEEGETVLEEEVSRDVDMHIGEAAEEEFPDTPEREGWVFDSWNTEPDGSGEIVEPGAEITEEMTVFACWRRIFIIHYSGNAPELEDMEEQCVAAEPEDTACEFILAEMERTGYTLLGWNTQADGSGMTYPAGDFYGVSEEESPLWLYALWEPRSCQITFAGTDVTLDCLYGETIPEEDIPQPVPEEGFRFGGWNTREDGSGRMFTADTPVTGDLTLYPCWSRPVEVTFVIVNGTWRESGSSTWVRTLEEGEPLGGKLPRAMPDRGFLPSGVWDEDPGELTARAGLVFTFTCDPIRTFRVSFDWTQETREITEGRNLGSLPQPEREGWTFAGWYTEQGEKVEEATVPTEDMSLYARWTRTHTLTYDVCGGEGAPEPETHQGEEGSWTFLITGQMPRKTGYCFRGWAETEKGAAQFQEGDEYTVSGDAILYAVWEPEVLTVRVRFLDGGTELANLTLDAGQAPGDRMPRDPSRKNAVFLGWNTRKDGSGEIFDRSTAVQEDMTVYAQWREIVFGTVIFRDRGSETARLEGEIGSALGNRFPAAPERGGYTFAGWNTRQDGSGTAFDRDTPVTEDLAVYAQWEKITRATVAFVDRGAEVDRITLDIGAQIGENLPGAPTRPGWRFLGWNAREDGTGKKLQRSTVIREDCAFYAQWEEIVSVTVTFSDRGEKRVAETGYGTALGNDFPTAPERDGYTFLGWNTQKDGSGKAFDKDTVVEDDITVYAQWEKITRVMVTFADRGAEVKRITLDAGAEVGDHLPEDPVHTGWRFLGWNTREDGTGKKVQKTTTVREDTTFYAQWEELVNVTVTFQDRDEKSKIEAKAGSALGTDFPAEPKRDGYTFLGWNTQKDGSGKAFEKDTVVENDLTVYAQWEKITRVTVIFADRGEEVKRITLDAGAEVGDHMPEDPVRTGWRFMGWNTREDGTGKKVQKTTTVREDTTFYAQWEEIVSVTVTFQDRDEKSKVDAKAGVALGTAFPAEPKRDGYTFLGWNTQKDGSGKTFDKDTLVEDDLTVYAQWEKITRVTLIFEDRGRETDRVDLDVGAQVGKHMPDDPERDGWRFLEWNTREDGTGKKLLKSTEIREDTTVYAQWEKLDLVTVTFMDRGRKVEEITLELGKKLGDEMPGNPTRSGYSFKGWNMEKDGSGKKLYKTTAIREDLTVYAQWSGKSGSTRNGNPKTGDPIFLWAGALTLSCLGMAGMAVARKKRK